MATLESLNSLAQIFLMVIPGIILARKNILSENHTEGISALVANLTWPCLVITAMQLPFSLAILKDVGYMTIIMLVIFLLSYLISLLLRKMLKLDKRKSYLVTFMVVFGNTGFIGLPVINALYGQEAAFYGSIVEMVNDILLFTVGIILIQLSAGQKTEISIKGMLSPGLIGVLIGFALFLLDFTLPEFIGAPIRMIGNATTPLSMIFIGLQIGRMKPKELFGDKDAYSMAFVKLLLIPAISYVIMVFVLSDTSLLAKTIIIDFAMPTAACATIFSQIYKGEVAFAVKGVLLTTLLSMATLPIFTILVSFF